MSKTEYPFNVNGAQYNVADLIYVLRSKGLLDSNDIAFISGRTSLDDWQKNKEE